MRAVLLLVCLLTAAPLHAQAWRTPPTAPNTIFAPDWYANGRPFLAFDGFDSGGFDSGLGVKQVAERALINRENYYADLLKDIAFVAMYDTVGFQHPPTPSCYSAECAREQRATQFESLAFASLVAFYVSLNDGSHPGEPTRFTVADVQSAQFFPIKDGYIDHKALQAALRQQMELSPEREYVAEYADEDSPFKSAKSAMAIARALDMYWAIENGYEWAND